MGVEAPPTTRAIAVAVLADPGQRSRLLAYARDRFGIGSDDAQDLLQDTALELLRQQSHIESPQGFVFALFRSRCWRFVERRRRGLEVFVARPQACEASPAPGGAGELDRRLALREALNGISSSCRRLLAAYYVEGQTLTETARVMELASSGVFKTINRCLQRLRRCIA
jgi:RNA polymerase sigma factor (sigma-70 family)